MNNQINIIRTLLIAFCLLVGGAASVSAQQDEATKKRDIRDKAYAVIDREYEAFASIRGNEAFYSFVRLFVNEEAPVYNDLLGSNAQEMMPVGDYARLLNSKRFNSKRIKIKNLKMESEPVLKDGHWTVIISFDKSLSYYNECGVYFSSEEFYHADYRLLATIVYDEIDGRCRIERIDGSINSKKKLPAEYVILTEKDGRDRQLSYHNTPLSFNSNRQAILPGSFDSYGFSHPKIKADKLYATIDDCNNVTMHYNTSSKMQIRPHFNLGLGDALTLNGGDTLNSKKSSTFSLGVDFGYTFFESNNIRLSAYAGLGITQSTIELDFDTKDYAHAYTGKDSADIDGDAYVRHYTNLKLSQTVKLTEINIPVYVDAEYAFNESFSAYANLGFRFNFNVSNSVKNDNSTADGIYGIYNTYPGSPRLDGEWGENGFSNSVKDIKPANDPELSGVNGMNVDLLCGLGLRYNIPNSPLAVDLGFGYVMGLGNLMAPEKTPKKENVYVDYSNKGGEYVHSLTDILENVKRKSMQLNIGLIYKF